MSYLDFLLIIEFILLLLSLLVTNMDMISPGVSAITVYFIGTLLLKFVETSWNIQISFLEVFIFSCGLLTILICEIFSQKVRFRLKLFNSGIYFSSQENSKKCSFRVNNFFRNVLSILSILFFIIYVFEIYTKGLWLGTTGLFSIGAVASSLSDGTEQLSFIGRVSYQFNSFLAYPFCWLLAKEIINHKNFKDYYLNLIPIICGLGTQFFAANRHNVLRILLAIVFCLFVSLKQKSIIKRKEKIKIIKYSFFIFAAFFFFFYMVRDVVKVSIHTIAFFEYIIYYLSSPIVLFGKYLINPLAVREASYYWGETCFTGFYATLMRWGLISEVSTETKHTIIGGLSGIRTGNTYTFFMRPYHDYGTIGVILLTFLIFGCACYIYHQKILRTSSSVTGYKNQMLATVYMSYFYYIFPLAISDFYITIESKIMTIIYIICIHYLCVHLIHIDIVEDRNLSE